MFVKTKTVNLLPIETFNDKFLEDPISRLIPLSDDTFITVSNTPNSATVQRYDINGSHISESCFTDIIGYVARVFLGKTDIFYLLTIDRISDYDETLILYKSINKKTIEVARFKRESYMHKMAYFNIFTQDNEIYLLLIRHNRLHKYLIKPTANDYDKLEEVDVLEGEKWYIDSADSDGYLLGCEGNDTWYLYNVDLEIVSSFDYDDRAVCVGVAASKDKETVAFTFNGYDNTSTISTYNIVDDMYNLFSISYQLYGTKIIGNKTWSLLYSVFSRFEPTPTSAMGGLLILDKEGFLQFAHIRNKTGGDLIRAYKPAPITSNAIGFQELKDGKVLILEQDRAIITDITCRELAVIPVTNGYNCVLSADKSRMFALHMKDGDILDDDTLKYGAELDIYTWENNQKSTQIIDIKSFRN